MKKTADEAVEGRSSATPSPVPEVAAASESAPGSAPTAENPAAVNPPSVEGLEVLTVGHDDAPAVDVPAVNEPLTVVEVGSVEEPPAVPDAPPAQAAEGSAPNSEEPAAGDAAQPGAFKEISIKKKRRGLKAALITLGVVVGVAAALYVAGGIVFADRFLPNTTIGKVDASWKTSAQVQELIQESVDAYQLDIVGGAYSQRVEHGNLGLEVDAARVVADAHADLPSWHWPVLLFQGDHDESACVKVSYDAVGVQKLVQESVDAFNETATPPEDATITYDESKDVFVVKPEVPGTQYQAKAVAQAAEEAILALEPVVQLGDEELVPPAVLVDDDRLDEAAEAANKMISADLKLMLADVEAGEIGPDELFGMVSMDEKFQVHLDEEALREWVVNLVNGFDTVGTERTYTRPDGKVVTISGGDYGWEVDSEEAAAQLIEAVRAGEQKTIEVPCISTAQVYNGQGQPDWQSRYADVDLSEQHVRFYDWDGSLIWESDCISGSPDGQHDTVPGVWSVNVKESPSKLIGWEHGKKIYETTVTYWMAFEENSIGFHDATWQPAFGGAMYAQGYGSHGCVNLPYYAAQELYGLIEVDDVVIVHW